MIRAELHHVTSVDTAFAWFMCQRQLAPFSDVYHINSGPDVHSSDTRRTAQTRCERCAYGCLPASASEKLQTWQAV